MIDGGDAAIPRRRWSIPWSPNAAAITITATVSGRRAVSGSLSLDIWFSQIDYYRQ
jgi:hypothetical protein